MSGVLVDSNVLLDVLVDTPHWSAWSADALRRAGDDGPLVINPIVYAEIAAGYDTLAEVDVALPISVYRREHLPWAAAFLAGKAYVQHRRRRGLARSPLPDFYVGAHAAVARYRLLTRDPARYRTYFPTVDLIAPAA